MMKFGWRCVMGWLWRFTLWRWFVIELVRFLPGVLGNFVALNTPLAWCLRDRFLKTGSFDLACKITADLIRRGDL